MRFLIARLSSLGDVVCTLPAATALKSSFPDSEVVWCVGRPFRGIVELCKAVDTVVEAPRGIGERRRTAKSLGEFDAAFDLQGLFKSAQIVGSCHAKRRLGYHWQREGAQLFSQAVQPDPSSLHVTDQYVDVVRAAGAECHRAEFGLKADEADIASVKSRLPSGDFVVCNAGAGWATKRWPAVHFAELTKRVTDMGLRSVFIGAEGDRAIFDEVRDAGGESAIDFVGKTSIRELVALVSIARAHIGGDTGSTHVAAAVGTPAIGLYSITKPERTCPYGQFENTLYDAGGLDKILPEAVVSRLERAIQSE